MSGTLRLINATLHGLEHKGKLYDIYIREGRFESVQEQTSCEERVQAADIASFGLPMEGEKHGRQNVFDLNGRMILPGMVDIHMHLDKAFSLPQVGNQTGTLLEAIQNYSSAASSFSKETIRARIVRTALQAVSYGSTRLRSHLDFNVNAGEDIAMRTVEAALEARALLGGVVELELYPMVPYRDLGRRGMELIEESLRMGLDGIGGAPHLSAKPDADIEGIFELAVRLGVPIDLHCDETDNPEMKTVLKVAQETLRYDYYGKVNTGHLCSLSSMPAAEADELIEMMSLAGVHAATLPAANLYLQGRADLGPVRRGVTRVRELMEGGVTLAAASDNIHDPFHPFGRGDLLQIAQLTGYAAHYGSPEDMVRLLDMVTVNPALIAGLENYGIRAGGTADFVIVDARSPEEVFTCLPAGRWVAKSGAWVSVTRASSRFGEERIQRLWEESVLDTEGIGGSVVWK
ncbi:MULTISPECIES: amidohydrolase family protein [unclassified Paenibacillus]|uniref:Amidohydrolase family protein n=1 Tax=Paenibacillus provencensis TaxID=441151 RepID=A0ABW3Q214_9BACL|nr:MULTISPECIES: amidohydrolase family protein [unclassified Paenibacillus]MCM3130043.1 amidohydrolase family protein [Paenibacillus sp. MER 78]SFS62070.1 cytosine deaminase [Paenibacillus sp. 453mf]